MQGSSTAGGVIFRYAPNCKFINSAFAHLHPEDPLLAPFYMPWVHAYPVIDLEFRVITPTNNSYSMDTIMSFFSSLFVDSTCITVKVRKYLHHAYYCPSFVYHFCNSIPTSSKKSRIRLALEAPELLQRVRAALLHAHVYCAVYTRVWLTSITNSSILLKKLKGPCEDPALAPVIVIFAVQHVLGREFYSVHGVVFVNA